MTRYAHVDGAVVPVAEATVSVRDRGFLYGDAVFETLRVYGEQPFAWGRHMDRLEASSKAVGMESTFDRGDLRERVRETLRANQLTEAYVRLSITRGVQPGRLTPAPAEDPTVVILAEPLPRGGEAGEAVWDGPATCTISSVQRIPNEAIPAAAKTHNYLNGILARLDARAAGCEEALMLDGDGYLAEGATTNLFFVGDGELRTPTTRDHPVLPGITRETVIGLAEDLGIPVARGAWTTDQLHAAEEAFLTNTTWEVRPVARVDDRSLPVGPNTERLMSAFGRFIEQECYGES